MKLRHSYRLPEEKQKELRHALKLEWITLFFMATIIGVMYLTMGSSQAMKTAWIEDMLSLIPPISFLVALHFRDRAPTERFPYGFRRSVAIAFLVAAVALTILGLYTIYDSSMGLIQQEHPTIGTVEILGRQVWLGWVMIAALIYSAIPPVILGHKKLPLAKSLHEKTLHTDAEMNKADWATALAGVLGILGIGMGWWWADSVAAGLIALDITKDGVVNLRRAVTDLMDQRPTTVENASPNEVVECTYRRLRQLSWVEDAAVRMREEGHVFSGEVFLVPHDRTNLVQKLEEATRIATEQSWQIYDIVATAVDALDPHLIRRAEYSGDSQTEDGHQRAGTEMG